MPNSKPWLDEALRDLYLADNPTCELLTLVEGESWQRLLRRNRWSIRQWKDIPACVHHVWSDRQRPDVWSNFVAVCEPVHAWIHANPPMGRTLCVWHKVRKGEFDLDEMREMLGRCPIGALGLYGDDAFEAWCLDLRMGLLEGF